MKTKKDYMVCKLEKIFTVKETEEIDIDSKCLMFIFLNGLSGISLGILWAMPKISQLFFPFITIVSLLSVFWMLCFDGGLTVVKVRKLVPRDDVKI